MKILFTKSKWEMGDDSLESFLRRAAADHFDAVEIYLPAQPAAVDLAIARASHIHARVGFEEGPQVPDPLHPLWSRWTRLHLDLWRRIIAARRADGAAFLTLTPEFGPPPYMPIDPRSGHPLADAWETNVRFRDWLQQNLPI